MKVAGKWIALGQTIDKGENGENLMASISRTKLRKEATDKWFNQAVLLK